MAALLFLIGAVILIVGKEFAAADDSHSHALPPCGEELHDISTFPGEARYNQSLVIYNPAYSHLHPSFFAFPKSDKDVQRCLKCADDKNVDLVLRSGGHCQSGYSTIGSEGFVVYFSDMNQVVIDESLAVVHVQAGARWSDVHDKTGSDYLIVGGVCPSVGVSGYTLGGGYGLLSRYHGLAIDNLLSATMVMANGSSVVFANSTVNPDLFWALRGGGGGNFGAVTEFSFKLHPTHPNYVWGRMKFLGNGTLRFLELLKIAPQLPKEVNLCATLFPSQKSSAIVLFIGSYSKALEILKPFIEVASSVNLKNYSSYDLGIKSIEKHYHAVSSHPELMRACILKEVSQEVARILFETEMPTSCRMSFEIFGGFIGEVAPNASAFYHRNGSSDYYACCLYSNTSEFAKVSQYLDEIFNSLTQGGHCVGGYINDIDPKVPDWQHFYYGENYERLVIIKEKWNPIGSGMLHFLQGIGSDYQPSSKFEDSVQY